METKPPKDSDERYYTWVLRKLKEKDGGQMEVEDVNRIKHQQYLAKEAGVDLSEEFDAVTSPDHYTRLLIQPIEFLMQNDMEYWRGCVIKYACRAGHKHHSGKSIQQSELDDLDKILEYCTFRKRQILGENITTGDEDETAKNDRKAVNSP